MIKSGHRVVALKFICVFFSLSLSAFALAQNAANASSVSDKNQPETTVSANGDTLLHCNDVIKITVYGEDDLTTQTRIEKNGAIRFPLLGSVTLAGRTIEQATEEIRSQLGKKYIKNPQVTLTIASYAKQWVTILGEVKNPGEVSIPDEGGLDLLGAIALAGGYTNEAETSHITVRRLVNGRDQIIQVDAGKLAHDSQVKPFYVQPGDTITIRQRMF